ncbi:MAG: hypothetical protein ACFB10_13135 [Salibacteraceae bacterium]|mgnify:CR=1 FL=1
MKKIIRGIAILTVVLFTFMSYKLVVYYKAEALLQGAGDYLKLTPTPLQVKPLEGLKTLSKTVHQLNFAYPDKALLSDTNFTSSASIKFEDSSSLYFSSNHDNLNLDYLRVLRADPASPFTNSFIKYISEQGISTNAQLINHTFFLQPGDVSWWDDSDQVRAQFVLLRLKELMMANGVEQGFYHFTTDHLKGFTFGDGQAPMSTVLIQLFDFQDNEYTLIAKGFDWPTLVALLQAITPTANPATNK